MAGRTQKTKRRGMRIRAGLAVLPILLASFAALRFLGTADAALFDADHAVRIDPELIEDSTLIIGTHLIYLHALDEAIYAVALDSAADSGQDRIYYRSELAGGLWIDITDAGSLTDITAAGKTVGTDMIAALLFTHHTKPDKITYDLWTGAPVCVFDIREVYDLEHLPELEQLKIWYDMMCDADDITSRDKKDIELVRAFFAMDVRSDVTDRCDAQIGSLQGYCEELAANGADSRDMEIVTGVMAKVDHARRAAVLSMVGDGLGHLQDDVSDGMDDALLTAIGDSMQALSESMSTAQGNMLAKGGTVLSETEYMLSERLIADAQGADYRQCDDQVGQLRHLADISDGRIVDRQEEIVLLDQMIQEADGRYGQCLAGGVSQAYMDLEARKASHAAIQARMKADMADVDAVQGELQFLIQARVDRTGAEGAQGYVLGRIQDAPSWRVQIRTDAYAQAYQDALFGHISWLNSLLSKIRGGSQDAEDTVYEQRADLQERRLAALDALDLDTARHIEAQIGALDEEIDALEGAVQAQIRALEQEKAALEAALLGDPQDAALLGELGRVEAQLSDSRSSLSGSSQAAGIMDSKDEVMGLIASGGTDAAALGQMQQEVEMLTALLDGGSPLALEALKEIYQALLAKSQLEDVSAYQALQDEIEDAVSQSTVRASLSGGLSAQAAEQAAARALGAERLIDADGNLRAEVPPEDLAACLLALSALSGQTGDKDLVQRLAAPMSQAGFLFQLQEQGGELFVPLEELARYAGWRYVWNDTKKSAVLSKGRHFYSFTAFRRDVAAAEGEELYMDSPALFSGGISIPASFVEGTFGCCCHKILGTDYAMLTDADAAARAQEILDELLREGGYGWE